MQDLRRRTEKRHLTESALVLPGPGPVLAPVRHPLMTHT